MTRHVRAGLILLAGLTLLATALAVEAILLETGVWTIALGAVGGLLAAWGGYGLRAELAGLVRHRRGEIAVYTAGVVGVLLALAYLSVRYPVRLDLTEAGRFSLSEPTVTMLRRLDRPVHVAFFHDPMMRETVELYELMARETPQLTLEFHDPVLNPAPARMFGVQFAGTSVMESEGRRLQVHGGSETDIANGILRVSRSATQRVCFLDGHGEPDPWSLESHDHLEGAPGHTHGLGAQYVLHERHGMARARHALETMNYAAAKVSLLQGGDGLRGCALLVVAGPKLPLLPVEVAAIRAYLDGGGHGFFMLDPFVQTGLEPLLREYGIAVDDDIVIDEASHFWADLSAPAVSTYNRHQITRDLPLTFFPGARSLSPTPERVPGTSVVALVNSSRRSWGQRHRERVEFLKGQDAPGPHTLMVVALRRPGAPDAAEALRGGADPASAAGDRRSRIAVVGDSDFATNSFFPIMGNGALFLNTVNYLAAQESLIGIQPRAHDLPRVNLTNRQMKGTFFLSVVLVPALLAVVGTAMWWRRR
ncbi:MAG: GldG family protein [Candidatus Rokubacteria bacterium]|nr:GldG family protein [Candidatus Rokubacteria bacterium]